ncbi:MAG: helix-turn-helix domain-containing protein [Bacilli bacterium]|nr:helix-turn-helix domain-containing protein [Bacilli bacterium]
MNFGDNLKSIRKAKKISQEELAEKLGVSRQSISKWETGENYPSMNNIICLCDIFHCKMNDIVHEDFSDINSLDPEIKMSVVKLKQKEQKRMKVLSKILQVVALIGKIGVYIAASVMLIATVAIPLLLSDVKYKNNTISFKNLSKDTMTFVEDKEKDEIIIVDKKGKKITDEEEHTLRIVKKALDNNSISTISVKLTIGVALLTIYLFILGIILGHIEKLFKNINKGDTPFTLENVSHIKKTAYYMIAAILVSSIGSAVLDTLASETSMAIDTFDLIEILFLFAMAYIFEYGVEIQKDSDGIMYDEQK